MLLPEASDLLRARDEFIDTYCEKKHWDREMLELPQILEIRQQPEWQNPLSKKPLGMERGVGD